MQIQAWLHKTTTQLQGAGIASARIDALALLEHATSKSKAWLLAHHDTNLTPETLRVLHHTVQQRSARHPLAYILGCKDFYGRTFCVTPNVLIPRPETEEIIEQAKTLRLPSESRVLDVGTGSGAIACTLALEQPNLHIEACDISTKALKVAQDNATALKARVTFFTSNLLQQTEGIYDCIVANLPYVDHSWEVSPETAAEPDLALFAPENGLALIFHLIDQAPQHLAPGGSLLIEADPRQHAVIDVYARRSGWQLYPPQGFIIRLQNK